MNSIKNNDKIVIACNRSIEFMEALSIQIKNTYPEIKIRLFTVSQYVWVVLY